MGDNNPVERFHELRQRYDEKHGHGATLDLKHELGLGSGQFNEKLSTSDVRKLNQELAARLNH